MTLEEMIKELKSLQARVDELLALVESKKEQKKDVLDEYWNNLLDDVYETYYLDSYNEIKKGSAIYIDASDNSKEFDIKHCNNYMGKEYAEQAQKLKQFNDMLLAFKWCHDRDYKDDGGYRIYYDMENDIYDYMQDCVCINNVIYFSSLEIAQKCCDWLNEKLAKG